MSPARLPAYRNSVISASYDLQKPQWSQDGRITAQQLAKLARAIHQIGLVDAEPDLTPGL